MPILDEHLAALCRIAIEELEREDACLFVDLDTAIRAGGASPPGLPRGVGFWIREEVLMFSIFRAALRSADLPWEIRWEYRYPASDTQAAAKMDLALFDRASNATAVPDACIEAKWWRNNGPVLKDIDKMQHAFPGSTTRKLVLLLGQDQNPAYETVRGWADAPPRLPLALRPAWYKTFRLRREKNLEVDGSHWPFFYLALGEASMGH